jgi:type IV secretory pathway VirB2 component (pilin)
MTGAPLKDVTGSGGPIIDRVPDANPRFADLAAQAGFAGLATVQGYAAALFALLAIPLGVFGGNLTAIGASANVVVLGVAMRSGSPISFWEFTRKGAIVTGVTIVLAAPYLWLRHFALAG